MCPSNPAVVLMPASECHHQPWAKTTVAILLAVLLLSLALAGWLWWPPDWTWFSSQHLHHYLQDAGEIGVVVYIGMLMMSIVISPIPSGPLAVVAGMVWGPILATIYSVIGGLAGGIIAYWLGLKLGQPIVRRLTGKSISFSTGWGQWYLGWVILLSRLLPVVSFGLVSYGAGIAAVSFPIYAIASLVGMIPSTSLLTALGSSATLESPLEIGILLIGFGLLIGLPYGAHRYNWFNLRSIIQVE